jgi:tRNA(Ile)-lysidine synthetase-like protein
LCESLKIDLHTVHVDPGRTGGNISAAARALRYRALAEESTKVGAKIVAVAHHAEDQFETILMALCRGAGLDGLAGMPIVRELNGEVRLLRPLLWSRRAECEDLCRAAGVPWVHDPTNDDLNYSRARLRHEVMPILDELWPDAAKRAAASAELVRAAQAALEKQLYDTFGDASVARWRRSRLAPLGEPIIAAGLRRAALYLAPAAADKIGQRQLIEAAEAIRASGGGAREFNWACELTLTIHGDGVELTQQRNET